MNLNKFQWTHQQRYVFSLIYSIKVIINFTRILHDVLESDIRLFCTQIPTLFPCGKIKKKQKARNATVRIEGWKVLLMFGSTFKWYQKCASGKICLSSLIWFVTFHGGCSSDLGFNFFVALTFPPVREGGFDFVFISVVQRLTEMLVKTVLQYILRPLNRRRWYLLELLNCVKPSFKLRQTRQGK